MADNTLLQNQKPCFETSNSKVFVNLHNAACEKAAKVVHMAYNGTINQFIINTGMSTDGRYVNDKLADKNGKAVGDVEKAFGNKAHKYEVGIVMQFTDFESPSKEDVAASGSDIEALEKKNQAGLEKLKKNIFEGLKEYFKWFSGMDIKEDDMVEFIPDYNGGKVDVSNYEIHGLEYDKDKLIEFLSNRKTDEKDQKDSKNSKPRVGYKIGYTIEFVKSNKEANVENPNTNK